MAGEKERQAFIEAGWAFSHAISDGEVCDDRSCFRCRLADLLFECERAAQATKSGDSPPQPQKVR